ncbi:MAG: alpha/beta hydrolase [Nevskia sp.]|nr:alpha/beta hydrolase [Nevskia sp.]
MKMPGALRGDKVDPGPTPMNAENAEPFITRRGQPVGLRSRMILWAMRWVLRPMLLRLIEGSRKKIARTQLRTLAQRCSDSAGLNIAYRMIGRAPGHLIGTFEPSEDPFVLWLHGGAFILPAAPSVHFTAIALLCRDLGASAFLPDYRLAPANPFPAGLDDCDRAYRALLAGGISPHRIVLGGDSAGGNLALGLLQRIRKAGLPNPACAVMLSPVTDLSRVGGLPSRTGVMKSDPILPAEALYRMDELYSGGADSSDPELSPLFADCTGFPPLYLIASDNEVLLDDSVMFARRAHADGVSVRCDIWPKFPHAFLLFEKLFPEVGPARADIVEFAETSLAAAQGGFQP